MKFIRTEGPAELENALGGKLKDLLGADKKILWLLSGGSNITAACKVMAMLPGDKLPNLMVSLTDERYGEPGHVDSNQAKLTEAGFDIRGAFFIPYLSGLTLADTTRLVETMLKTAYENADVTIGLLGMGPDGHTAGILPESIAASETVKWVVGYDGGQFKRVTLTVPALEKVDIAYLGAYGKEKLAALLTLENGNLPVAQQPAQLLKQVPESYVYNDQVGEESVIRP